MTDSFRHKSDCPEPNLNRITGRMGDPIDRCRNCGRFRIIRDPSEVLPAEPGREKLSRAGWSAVRAQKNREPTSELEDVDRMIHYPPPIVGPWVCGIHIDHPVTWRGTGCPECEREQVQRQAARRKVVDR